MALKVEYIHCLQINQKNQKNQVNHGHMELMKKQ